MIQKKLKILQFCNKAPYPPVDGGAIGMHNVSQGLIDEGNQLKLLTFETHKHPIQTSEIPDSYIETTRLESVFVDLRVKKTDALKNLLFSKRSYNIVRFFDVKMKDKLIEILQQEHFDIIQIESIFLKDYVPIIRQYSKAKVVLRAPNVEYVIWDRLSEIEKNPFKKYYLSVLAKRLKREEIAAYHLFDAIYTVTQEDLEIIKQHCNDKPMAFIPTGIDVTKDLDVSKVPVEYPSIFHLGALDWFPNQKGIQWFLDHVWKVLHEKYPNLIFYIAGRRPPEWLKQLNLPNVKMIGEVKDAGHFIKSKAIMIVPLFSGSGMRVKIIEAMMLQKAIVTTSIGIEGIIHEHEKNVMVADHAEDFIASIIKLVDDQTLYESICKTAKENAAQYYSNAILTKKLMDFFYTL
ncbi:MAG: hypothetical protein CSA94_01155 [Bacteroidetes bacterium]|nr:MAG: hypothetical protein CSA94_01155 [Bacteroidota bacterium]